ncbi:glycosyltransferase involved in cell wall biosynthesis [Rhodanobacter sp. ANJX3]|uniref:glycosyltransferase n=1 Tax=unclassified Rhodanobacter TaxID=2621553 RepID=UPI00184EE223|nr:MULTISPECIES: glycosyltransferase [unclassified Rhodanobacter]MBB5360825.1 glycosyltransferase involved in cell wall biosynthesis [Rhodanobacter sp. ANJX3]NYE30222.1 glycosyltransferase involved in cell wall biosynthesis [Rhodanobacter sp. K2T2]
MIILVHTAFHGGNVASNLGQPEYSYYFVLREFRPMLEQLGIVIDIHNPERDVDVIYRNCLKRGVPCVFLSFLPPNKTPLGLACPTIPVFAWEYPNIPDEDFSGKTRNDWRRVLKQVGAAITHSTFTVEAVKRAVDGAFPIIAAPAPLWDRLAAGNRPASPPGARSSRLRVDGMVIDSRLIDLSNYSKANELACAPEPLPLPRERCEGASELELDGIVYTSVFNPGDGRKNWVDMISAFCVAFARTADATLLLKLSHHDIREVVPKMLECMHKGDNFACRVVIVHGYLRQEDYECMVDATTYAVNTSHGEGQCLPLMEYMSSGKPAISPRHTAMLDYIDESCAFVVDSFLEPGTWPHDMRQAFRTLREHVRVDSLIHAYRSSYYVAKQEPDTYRAMAAAARESLRAYCSHAVVGPRLAGFLQAVIASDLQQAGSLSPL